MAEARGQLLLTTSILVVVSYAELAEIPFLSVICTMWHARSLPLAQYCAYMYVCCS